MKSNLYLKIEDSGRTSINKIYLNITYLTHKRQTFETNENVFTFRMLREIEELSEDDEAFASSYIQFNIGIELIKHNRTHRRGMN